MTRPAILCVAVIGITACGADSIPAPRNVEKPPSLDSLVIVSDAALQSSSSSTAMQSGTSETLSYVSMPEGSAAKGVVATIRNPNLNTSVTVTLVAGGFDPVPVAGQSGDTLELDVRDASGEPVLHGITTIPARKKPVVVRSSPPPRKRDVPLNTIITVVFSEPMNAATLTAADFQLLNGTEVISGQIVLNASRTQAQFTPSASLEGNITYTVSLSDRLADASGEHLQATSFEFTTIATAGASIEFVQIADMTTARSGHSATLLADGRVLIAGGYPLGSTGGTAELYDPATRTFSPTGRMVQPRYAHTATLLPNGQVLLVGPNSADGAELYDPTSGTFVPTGAMVTSTFYVFSATLLANGSVLVAGDTAVELYNPATGTFRLGPPYAFQPYSNQATLLRDGRVLFAGDEIGQVYDPVGDRFTITGAMGIGGMELQTQTLLEDGTVLIAGGMGMGRYRYAVLFDPETDTFSRTGDVLDDRDAHAAVRLPNGKVLLVGGDTMNEAGMFGGSLASAELYDPQARTFASGGRMHFARTGAQATLLPNGDVLITGGVTYCGINCFLGFLPSAELYHPPPATPAATLRARVP